MSIMTPKREKFCQEIVKGLTYSDAYRKAYNTKKMKDETINNNAYMLMQKSEIRARVEELKAKVEKKLTDELVYTAKQSFDMFKMLQDLALEQSKPEINNALKAEEFKARLAKLLIERKELSGSDGQPLTPIVIQVEAHGADSEEDNTTR